MILGFKTIHPFTGQPTNFKEKILSGTKIHTIRNGFRWKSGMKINFATGVRTKDYDQFKEGICTHVQTIQINPDMKGSTEDILIDDRIITYRTFKDLIENDGFDNLIDFWNWFKDPIHGQIIHWTDKKY